MTGPGPLVLYDDAVARAFAPFVTTRPVSELRCGSSLLRRRWERGAGCRAASFISAAWLADFEEFDAPASAGPDTVLPTGAIVANSRCAVALDEVLATGDEAWACGDRVCAVRLREPVPVRRLEDGALELERLVPSGAPRRPLRGRWLGAVWDLIAVLPEQLAEDLLAIAPRLERVSVMYDSLGSHPLTVEDGATVEPYVVFDATAGPIVVRRGARVSAFTRVVGPCYIGEHASLQGDRVASCAIGEHAKIRGEMSMSVVLGHANKGHTGFIGHSYLGRWVNLGAGTTTSNLKNTYGPVQLWTPEGFRDTGQQFLGTFFGDHVKTGIGTMLTTGTVLGAGASVFGTRIHPKWVPPFAWGEAPEYATYDVEKLVAVAARAMRRRDVTLGSRQADQLRRAHATHAARIAPTPAPAAARRAPPRARG